jgi:hypothetical protein
MVHCTAGAAAGALASGLSNPLDVIKTRLQTMGEVPCGMEYTRGIRRAAACTMPPVFLSLMLYIHGNDARCCNVLHDDATCCTMS